MRLEIKNYRGIERADITLSPFLTVVCAWNRGGKSSVAQALAAAILGKADPIGGIKKSEFGMLMRTGSTDSFARFESDKGTSEITWPAGTVVSNSGFRASEFSTGMQTFMRSLESDALSKDRRSELIKSLLKVEATEQDLSDELQDLKMAPESISALWAVIQEKGWQGAEEQIAEKGRQLKAKWLTIVGPGHAKQWGESKGRSFFPQHWEKDLAEKSEQSLAEDVALYKQELENAISAGAFATRDIEELQKLIALGEEESKTRIEALRADVKLCSEAWEKERNVKVDPIPTTFSTQYPFKCDCGIEHRLVLRANALEKATEKDPDPSEILEGKKRLAAQKIKIQNAEIALDQAKAKVTLSEKVINDGMRAARELEALKSQPEGTLWPEDIEKHRGLVLEAERRLTAFKAKREADKLNTAIEQNVKIGEVLKPSGVRRVAMLRALDLFNSRLKQINDAAGWGDIKLDAELEPSLDNRPFILLSGSEKFTVNAVLKLAIAQLDGSEIVVLDAVDVLVVKTRLKELTRALAAVKIPAVIMLAANEPSEIPDLSKVGGLSYWIQGGRVISRSDAVAA